MLKIRTGAALLTALLFALPFAAPAEETDRNPPVDRLVEKYSDFAGSPANAERLIHALRNDQTGKMGWGNVDIALSLAKATLEKHGIDEPTPEQIVVALNGGTITIRPGETITLEGILELRARGMGWGQIAQHYGFKLGELMRNDHARREKPERKHAGGKHNSGDLHAARLDRPDRPLRFDRPERPERPGRPERAERGAR